MQEEAVSVSELTYAIKGLLETGIGDVLVHGELSNFKHHTSGHRYFTLKDANAQISCVMWRSRNLTFRPEDGMRVVLGGKLAVYAAQGKYQIDGIWMQPEGVGDLYKAFEALKRELGARGYFEADHKRQLPPMPLRVGVSTSATGAAVQDVLSTIQRRFPIVQVVFRPTIVQGEGSALDVAKAISELQGAGVDVIIVGRGGGSIEDLWSFNTIEVAEAIYNCSVPVVSAVGHETDFTIADFVADVRAATPTAAAELVTPITIGDLMYQLDLTTDRMTHALQERITRRVELVHSFMDGRALRRLQERIQQRIQRMADTEARLTRAIKATIQRQLREVAHASTVFATLHPLKPLSRGYAVIERNGRPLSLEETLHPGDVFDVRRQTEVSSVRVESTRAAESRNNENQATS